MGKSHQLGSVVLRGKAWYGFYRKDVIDPETEDVRSVRICVRLGLKSEMTKPAAREALRAEITKQTGQVADGRIRKGGSVTFESFVRNRYFPVRQGDWRPETASFLVTSILFSSMPDLLHLPNGSRQLCSVDRTLGTNR